MAQVNRKTTPPPVFTHEGGKAVQGSNLAQLRRSVMSCMLWEDGFYESGERIGERIAQLVHKVSMSDAAAVAVDAREKMKLRHVPLLIARELARHPDLAKKENQGVVKETLARVIQRADELTEFVSIYWKDGKCPLSAQVKKGLAKAFTKFSEYDLAKYNRDKDVRLRDVLFLCHAKPADVTPDMAKWNKAARAEYAHVVKTYGEAGKEAREHELRPDGFTPGELLQGKLVYDQLATPDTWEVELSAGKDKKATFERLMTEKKLGALAFLRNLRNMDGAGVNRTAIKQYGDSLNWGRVLPFRFIAAARVVPQMEPMLEPWMLKCARGLEKLPGRTVLLVDVSGSMSSPISSKSDLSRIDAAKALAMLLREICEDVEIYAFNNGPRLVPARQGFALGDAIGNASGGTKLGASLRAVYDAQRHTPFDRTIVITDEQSADRPSQPQGHGYILNVASHQNGIGYGAWRTIDGWSEAVIDYIREVENDS